MRRSIYRGAGYLLADDRCSGGKVEEADMLVCAHKGCGQRLMRRSEWQADGGFCHSCDAPICGPCATRALKHGCEVFLRVLESALEKEYRLEQNSMLLGLNHKEQENG